MSKKPSSATIKITKPPTAPANRPLSPATRSTIRKELGLDTIAKAKS
jgi:hypothetical protein